MAQRGMEAKVKSSKVQLWEGVAGLEDRRRIRAINADVAAVADLKDRCEGWAGLPKKQGHFLFVCCCCCF